MNDPDIATWGEDTERLDRDREIDGDDYADWQYEVANGDTRRGFNDWLAARAEMTAADIPDREIDSSPDHQRTVWFFLDHVGFHSRPACTCGWVGNTSEGLTDHLREKLNP